MSQQPCRGLLVSYMPLALPIKWPTITRCARDPQEPATSYLWDDADAPTCLRGLSPILWRLLKLSEFPTHECDVRALHDHFRDHGRREGRRFGCEAPPLTAAEAAKW